MEGCAACERIARIRRGEDPELLAELGESYAVLADCQHWPGWCTLLLKDHHDRVPYDLLPRHVQVFLISLGYPAKDAGAFRATVKSILEDIGGRKKRRDTRAVDHSTHPPWVKPIPIRAPRTSVALPALAFGSA